jgi:UDP-N-acetylmuramoyl-tripeptide--D-alanyl-D-alanine ligase
MNGLTLSRLQQWLGGQLVAPVGAQDVLVEMTGMTTDSRAVTTGSVFVALRGERFDAHDFLADVVARGAVAVIVDRVPEGLAVPALVVRDTRAALGVIAQQWRCQFAVPVIGVTGSNGKTTVKEMLAAIAQAAFGEAGYLATRGNFNNDIGVPLTLFRMAQVQQAAIIELGMNHPGEIAVLADIARPTVGLVNNAQREHQEFMATVEAVARENGAVITALPADGVAVFPADDAYTALWTGLAGTRRIVTFGLSDEANVRAQYRAEAFGNALDVTTEIDGVVKTFSVQLAAAGEHNVNNALAAIACALAANIDVAAIVAGLQAFAPVAGRLQRKVATNGALVIDDTYNANPDSVRAAIDVLAKANAPSVFVLGDMGEVGSEGKAFHEEIGRYASECGMTHFFGLGELMQHATAAFNAAAGKGTAQYFTDIDALNQAVGKVVVPGSTVLVKGSRFMKMERVVQFLVQTDNTRNLQGAH